MKRLIVSLVIIASILLPQVPVEAKQPDYAVGVNQVVSNNMEVRYTGKRLTDNSGNQKYEYVATIYQAPIYNDDGSKVDCSWHYIDGRYEIQDNVFSVQVNGAAVTVSYNGEYMSWNPVILVDIKEYNAKDTPLLINDIINPSYISNTLEWDYGVCKRRLRVIEGLIQETWIFDKDPKGTLWIKDNVQKSSGFTYAVAPYAYDFDGNYLSINEFKQISAAELSKAVYPVTIDPTDSFVTSASDGYLYSSDVTYATVWAMANGEYINDTGTTLYVGQAKDLGAPYPYDMYRAALYFDTSSLPDGCTITAVNLSLYCQTKNAVTNYNVTVMSGMPTYPHDPLVVGDFDKTNYTSIGGSLNSTSISAAAYFNISLNTTGIGFINKVGDTKLMLRSSRDIDAIPPATAGNKQYLVLKSYEAGVGYRPYLEVSYISSGSPNIQTNDATYVTKTTARLNGYISNDGGEAVNASFNLQPWYSAGWQDCIEFTINASYVDADLSGFPVLVTGAQLNTTDTDFWSVVNSSGSDIVFTASDGVTKLNRELVSINTTAQTMECYVNVTSIDDTTDTKFYMYYNSANISLYNESNSTATWDVNYVAVYHMNDNPNTSTIQDSTVNNRDGTKVGAGEPLETTGYFNGDKAQVFDGVNDYINASISMSSTDDITLESIAKTFNTTATNTIISANVYITRQSSGPNFFSRGDNSGAMQGDLIAFSNNSYFYGAATYDQDGVNSDLNTRVNTTAGTANHYTKLCTFAYGGFIGKNSVSGSAFWNGSVSEVRVSNTYRSDAWQSASYYTLMYPTTFAPVTDVFTTTSSQSKNTGDSYYISQTGLTANTLYGYKAESTNSYGTSWGAWVLFNTTVTLMQPTNVLCNPSGTSIELIWNRGANTSNTYIRYSIGGYPNTTSEGNALPLQSGVDYVHTGLSSGTSYFYTMWGEGSGSYSASHTHIMCSTTAAGPSTTVSPLPTTNMTDWQDDPDSSALTNHPLYAVGNLEADAVLMPHNTWWMLVGMGFLVVLGLYIYTRSDRNLLAALGAMIIFGVIFSQMGIFPIWCMILFGLAGIGMGWKELR